MQEYKQGISLAACARQGLKETKHIAAEILKILVYLQSLSPSVIHRDIKLENILLEQTQKVTLVDFGFARTGGNALGASSVVVGTYGMMPPEQLLNREVGCASDLYSLGATLICLLAGIKSVELANFVDETFAIDTKRLLPAAVAPSFRWWLEKMVAPKIQNRFHNAQAALEALQTGQIEPSQEMAPRLKRTRDLAKTTVAVSLAASILISGVGGIGFGVYKLVQWGEQQKDAYQVPDKLPVVKPKPHRPKQASPTKDIESQFVQILGTLPYVIFCLGIASTIYGVLRVQKTGEEMSSVLAPGMLMMIMAVSFEIINPLLFLDSPSSNSPHSNQVLIEKP